MHGIPSQILSIADTPTLPFFKIGRPGYSRNSIRISPVPSLTNTAPRPLVEHENKQHSSEIELVYDPLLPAEHAYEYLLFLLESNSPWQVTPKFLFSICHILEDSLAFSGISTAAPCYLILPQVLRTMRIWRPDAREGRNLERLASDLARLLNVELPSESGPQKNNLKCDYRIGNTSGTLDGYEKENIPPRGHKHAYIPHGHAPKTLDLTTHYDGQSWIANTPGIPLRHRGCEACKMLRSGSHSHRRSHKTLHSLHDHDALPLSSRQSQSQSHVNPLHPCTNFDYEYMTRHAQSDPKTIRDQYPTPLRPALRSLEGGVSYLRTENKTKPLLCHITSVTNETESTPSEVWIKRRSQEDGWRV